MSQRSRLFAALAMLLAASFASAHETDNFSLPVGREFADLGPYFDEWAYGMIVRGVEKTNDPIRRAVEQKASDEELASLADPNRLVGNVNSAIPWALDVIENLEHNIQSSQWRRKYPGKVVGYKPLGNVYSFANFPLDPRQLIRLIFSGTVMADGVYFGTDKVGHFTDMGMHYYGAYRSARSGGATEEEAMRRAAEMGTSNPIFSERGFLGYLTAGSFSNADLVANYAGCLFYRNLYEPVKLKGEIRPPMVVRDGPYWKVADHVRPDSNFFSWFISEHWDEALNASKYDPTIRGGIRRNIRNRSDDILLSRVDRNGDPRSREYFEQKLEDLTTYYGQPYGHAGSGDDVVTIANTCYDSPDKLSFKESPLHYAAARGAIEDVRSLAASREAVSGRNDRLNTPLHRAVEHRPVVELLLAKGADVNARNVRGRTPLHSAAADPESKAVSLLAAKAADLSARDTMGRSPLHLAAESGHAAAVGELLKAGAKAGDADRLGATPLHLAAGAKNAEAVKQLLDGGGGVSARDEFGYTPLHDAARSGSIESVRMLLAAGADANAADAYGTTPLHLACRGRRLEVAQTLLDKGGKVSSVNAAGNTPLHEAAFRGDRAIVSLLLSRGASSEARNARGQTTIDVAAAKGHHNTVELLRQKAS